jgi:prepilin-type N-terminal cleavage/methylation domain-containing protein
MSPANRFYLSHKGFTLFELIITVGIILLIFSAALAGYNTFNRRERLKQAGLTLQANLRFAQTKAFSAEKPGGGCATFTGMQVSFTASSYTVDHACTNGVYGTSQTVTLPPGITFAPVPTTFTFLALKEAVDLSSDKTLTLTNSSQTYTILVSTSGVVTVQKIQ